MFRLNTDLILIKVKLKFKHKIEKEQTNQTHYPGKRGIQELNKKHTRYLDNVSNVLAIHCTCIYRGISHVYIGLHHHRA